MAVAVTYKSLSLFPADHTSQLGRWRFRSFFFQVRTYSGRCRVFLYATLMQRCMIVMNDVYCNPVLIYIYIIII